MKYGASRDNVLALTAVTGAGEPGAYLGRNFFDTPSVCDNPATGLPCNGFGADGETDFSGNLITGRYRFVFRNGVPVAVPDDDTTDVPAPPMLLLLGLGIGTVAGLRPYRPAGFRVARGAEREGAGPQLRPWRRRNHAQLGHLTPCPRSRPART